MAREFAKKHGIKLTEFLPEREKFGREAARLRNTTIIEYCDCCFAFIKNNSRGTLDAVQKCRAKGKSCEVTVVI